MKWLDGARARLRLLFARSAAESRMNRRVPVSHRHGDRAADAREGPRARRGAAPGAGRVRRRGEAQGSVARRPRARVAPRLVAQRQARRPHVLPSTRASPSSACSRWRSASASAPPTSRRSTISSIRRFHSRRGIASSGFRTGTSRRTNPTSLARATSLAWQDELTSVQHLGAFRSISGKHRRQRAVRSSRRYGAEITPSAFRRRRACQRCWEGPLVAADEQEGARRSSSSATSCGGTASPGIRCRRWTRPSASGTPPSMVVGVMPEGFAFPVSHHFWVPLRRNALGV